MVDLLYRIIYRIAIIHDQILGINNAGGWYFNDKQLHFIVIGVLGMLMIFVTYPVFKLLAKYNHTMVISWLYVFTLILVLTFAIEIGQWFSGTGTPDVDDMASGVAGFLIMFLIFAVIRAIFHGILRLFHGDEGEAERDAERQQLRAESERMRKAKVYHPASRETRRLKDTRAFRTSADITELRRKGETSIRQSADNTDLRRSGRSQSGQLSGSSAAEDRKQKRKINLADIAHEGGASIKNIAAGGKFLLEDLAEEFAEDRMKTEEVPRPLRKIDNPRPAGQAENDDRITYIMPSPAEGDASDQNSLHKKDDKVNLNQEEQAEYDDVARLFAEFDKAAAEEDLASGGSRENRSSKKPERNSNNLNKQSDISERPVYKE